MTEQNLKNNELIDTFVTNHFSLNSSGLKLFKKVLNSREEKIKYIDEKFHDFLDEDLRATFTLPFILKADMDNGWGMFKKIFDDFLDEYEVSYEDYSKNKIIINKQEAKLFKYIKKWYLEQNEEKIDNFKNSVWRTIDGFSYSDRENFDYCFKRASEKIGTMKLPDKDLKAVLSFNFADWFLVSTAESWSSCLNLQSDYEACYWSGLPGLITDPNRMLIYITDSKSKSYRGITVDKFITRTWGLLEESDVVFPVRHYPLQIISDEAMNTIFPFSVYEGSLDRNNSDFYRGKHLYKDIVTNYENESVYIYQDGTGFNIKKHEDGKQEVYIYHSHSGYYKLINNKNGGWRIDEDTIYNYTDGLDGLIDRGCQLKDHPDCGVICSNCGDHVNEDNVYFGPDEQPYCEDCFDENFISCLTCGETMAIEDAHQGTDGDYYCEYHFNRNFFYCDNCGEVASNNEQNEVYSQYYCNSCFASRFEICTECKTDIDKRTDQYRSFMEEDGEQKVLCANCFDAKYIECKDCDSIVKKEDICKHGDDELCHSCFTKRIQPDFPEIKEELIEGAA